MEKDKYKTFKINVSNYTNDYINNTMSILSYNFNKDDFFVERIDNEIIIYLNQIDMKYLASISCEFQNQIITNIYEKIKNIRSYIVKEGKRQLSRIN